MEPCVVRSGTVARVRPAGWASPEMLEPAVWMAAHVVHQEGVWTQVTALPRGTLGWAHALRGGDFDAG